jgi:hypothetical protein
MEMNTRSTRHPPNRRSFIGGSDARIIMETDEGTSDHDGCRVQHWGEKAEQADPRNRHQNLNRHWYAAITGGMPPRWYIVVVGYGTIVILLGWYPLNILLMLLSLPHYEFRTTRSVLGRMSGRHGTLQ